MPTRDVEVCPDCGAKLPAFDGPTHRYIGASPACWALFAELVNAGNPPLAPAPLNDLITDAYAVQHHGTPSPQTIQSVAVHLLVLYGILVREVAPGSAQWIRERAMRRGREAKHDRFRWLAPPALHGSLTIADIAQGATPADRAETAGKFVTQVWELWARQYEPIIGTWYDANVVPDRLLS